MRKRSKRYKENLKQINKANKYSIDDAVKLALQMAGAKFKESVDISINLNLKASQRVRGTVVYPNSIGKERTVLVFAKGDKADEAKAAKADFIGDDDLIQKIKGGWMEFDVAIATPDMMKEVGKLGAILGKKGLMPNPKTGTVTLNLKDAVTQFKAGKYEFKSDKASVIHMTVGKTFLEPVKIVENAKTLLENINKSRPADVKGEFIKSITISTTMGVGIKCATAIS